MEVYGINSAANAIQTDENTFRIVTESFESYPIVSAADTNSPEDGFLKVGEEIHGWEIVGFYGPSIVVKVPGGYTWSDNSEDAVLVEYTHLVYFHYSAGPPPEGFFIVNTDDLPVCFCKGTLIETNTGPVAIEKLQEGDYVLGSKGWQRVKWIGWRKYNLQLPWITPDKKTKCVPVRITQGALGGGLPTNDLSISPWHHVYIDGQLVRANDIVNGVTILREMNAKHIEYYHLELDKFDVIQAHGVFSESWADGGNRSFFENVKVTDLKPEDSMRRQADRPGFVLMRDKKAISELNLRLGKQARLLENKKTA